MGERRLSYQFLPVSHTGVQDMDRSYHKKSKSTHACRACLTRLRSGKCNAVLLVVSAFVVWIVIHFINKTQTDDFSQAQRPAGQEDPATDWKNSGVEGTQRSGKDAGDVVQYHDDQGEDGLEETTEDMYDNSDDELDNDGSGYYGTTENTFGKLYDRNLGAENGDITTDSDVRTDEDNVIDFEVKRNTERTDSTKNYDYQNQDTGNLGVFEYSVDNDEKSQSIKNVDDTNLTGHQLLANESNIENVNTAIDLNQTSEDNNTGDPHKATDNQIKDNLKEDEELEKILKQYDTINTDEKLSYNSDMNNNVILRETKLSDITQPVADSKIKSTERMIDGSNSDVGRDQELRYLVHENVGKVEITNNDIPDDSAQFKTRNLMNLNRDRSSALDVKTFYKDSSKIRRKRSLAHVIKVPMQLKKE